MSSPFRLANKIQRLNRSTVIVLSMCNVCDSKLMKFHHVNMQQNGNPGHFYYRVRPSWLVPPFLSIKKNRVRKNYRIRSFPSTSFPSNNTVNLKSDTNNFNNIYGNLIHRTKFNTPYKRTDQIITNCLLQQKQILLNNLKPTQKCALFHVLANCRQITKTSSQQHMHEMGGIFHLVIQLDRTNQHV